MAGVMAGVVLGAAPAAAAYADECAAPTTTLTGGSAAPLAVAAGQTLLLTAGTYTGGIDALPAGARICVAADASLSPAYLNNGAGSILVRGAVRLPSIAVGTGFVLDNEGSATLDGSLNTNGLATIINRGGATLSATATLVLSNGSVLTNIGTADLAGGLILNAQAALDNSGSLTAASLLANGSITNSGLMTVPAGMVLNSGGELTNQCRLDVGGDLALNAATVNNGVIAVGGALNNNALYNQSTVGITTGRDFTNDATVTGFGRFSFTGTTRTQNQFVGTDPVAPITFYDTTSGGSIFDVTGGTVANTVRAPVTAPDPGFYPATCATGPPTVSADLEATKTGPATVAPGGTVTYRITVVNHGPDAAGDVVVVDDVPAALANVTTSPGAVLDGGTVTQSLGTLPAGATAELVVTGTAPASGTLLDVVRATSSTPDPDPSNNDGSHAAAQVVTQVVAPPVNHPPAVGDSLAVIQVDEPAFGVIPFSDSDPGQAVTLSLTGAPQHGTVVVQANGVFAYQPGAGFTGRDTFSVTGCDNGEPVLCETGTVTVVVLPVAANLSVTTYQGIPVRIPATANDRGVVARPVIVAVPSHGSSTVDPDDAFTYTPAVGFIGSDLLRYRVCSVVSPDVCAEGTVAVSVLPPPNRPPVVGDSTRTTPAGEPVAGMVTVSDPDPGQTVTVALDTPPNVGSAVVDPDGTYTYTPPDGFSGVVTFTVRACDDGGQLLCASGTVTITVTPVANADAAATTPATPIDIDVLQNDVAAAPPPVVLQAPSGGTAVVQPGNTIRYTPAPGTTADSFTYQVCSPNVATLCATATVTVAVDSQPGHPPALADQERSTIVDTPVGGQLTADDAEGGQLTYSLVSGPAAGSATVTADGAWIYTPPAGYAGQAQFTVQVCDAAPACTVATVRVSVFPVAVPDTALTTANVGVTLAVTANDLGTIGEPVVTTLPGNGIATVTGTDVAYQPDTGFTGVDILAYEVCAAPGNTPCVTATVTVTVSPVAVNDAAVTFAGTPVVIAIGANDVGTTGVPRIAGPPAHGTVTSVAAGPIPAVLAERAPGDLLAAATATYQPSGGYTGYDQFSYQICAPAAPSVCAFAVVTVTIRPDTRNDSASTVDGVAIDIPVTLNDIGDAGPPEVTGPPTRATVTVLPDGSVRYSPLPGFTGTNLFTYRRCSLSAPDVCSTADVVIVILAAPAPPEPSSPGPVLPVTGAPGILLILAGIALVGGGCALRRIM